MSIVLPNQTHLQIFSNGFFLIWSVVHAYFPVDGSKARQKLRKKISAEKETLKQTVERFNQLCSSDVSVSLDADAVGNGNFPWKAEQQNGGAKLVILHTAR